MLAMKSKKNETVVQSNTSSEKIKFFDAHFHLWDCVNGAHVSIAEGLKEECGQDTPLEFGIKDYENLVLSQNDVELIGGVEVECGVPPFWEIEEVKWVDSELNKSTRPYAIVSGIPIQYDVTEVINYNKTLNRWRGFRDMLNWNIQGDHKDPLIVTDPFLNQVVKDNFKAMEAAGATFDLQLFISQYSEAADVLDTVPNLTVIIDHRGWPDNFEDLNSQEYWDGLKRFAAMPNVYMKISFFVHTDPKWE